MWNRNSTLIPAITINAVVYVAAAVFMLFLFGCKATDSNGDPVYKGDRVTVTDGPDFVSRYPCDGTVEWWTDSRFRVLLDNDEPVYVPPRDVTLIDKDEQ